MSDHIDPKAHAHYCRELFNLIEEINRDGIEVSFDEIRQRQDEYLNATRACQSPIEQMFAAGLAFANDGYNAVRLRTTDYHVAKKLSLTELAPDFGTRVFAQAGVGKYRLDFLAVHSCGGRHAFTAIECDGHDFHERTKEQAARDKSRDRFLTGRGIPVLRFTGSEIYRNVRACVDDAVTTFARQVESVMPEQCRPPVGAGALRG